MAMHQFKAESKKLLDLMINSIYTNREIFLRELISNASDACDKRYFKSLTDTSIGITKDDLKIHIQPDKDSRTLTITDNGIGMTKEELEKNLGTIAGPAPLTSRPRIRAITSTSSVSSASASIPRSWWPKRSPSSPARRALTRPGSGSPPASRATP